MGSLRRKGILISVTVVDFGCMHTEITIRNETEIPGEVIRPGKVLESFDTRILKASSHIVNTIFYVTKVHDARIPSTQPPSIPLWWAK